MEVPATTAALAPIGDVRAFPRPTQAEIEAEIEGKFAGYLQKIVSLDGTMSCVTAQNALTKVHGMVKDRKGKGKGGKGKGKGKGSFIPPPGLIDPWIELSQDLDFVLVCVASDGSQLQFAGGLRNDPYVVATALRQNWKSHVHAGESLRRLQANDVKAIVVDLIATIKQRGEKIGDKHWKAIKDLCEISVKGDPDIANLVFESTERRIGRTILAELPNWSGPAGMPIQDCKEMMVKLIAEDCQESFRHTHEWDNHLLFVGHLLGRVSSDILMNDRVVQFLVGAQIPTLHRDGIAQIPTLEDKEVAMKWVKASGLTLGLLGPNIQKDREVVLTALKNFGAVRSPRSMETVALVLRDPAFRDDLDIFRAILSDVVQNNADLEALLRRANYPTDPDSLGMKILAGAHEFHISLSSYAELLSRGPRCFIVNITPSDDDNDVDQGFVNVTVTGLGGVCDDYPRVPIDSTWSTTRGFRDWYAHQTNDRVPDFSVVFGDSNGTTSHEVPLLDHTVIQGVVTMLDPQFQPYVQFVAPPAPPVVPARNRGFGNRAAQRAAFANANRTFRRGGAGGADGADGAGAGGAD